MTEHRNITDPDNHEPKGASTAVSGSVYTSNGEGSGSWMPQTIDSSSIQISRLLDGASLSTSQEPSAVDTPLQIEFGAAQFNSLDPVMLGDDGSVTFNDAGTYRIKISLAVGRTGGSGTSELYARALINGSQAGQSIHFKIGADDEYTAYSDEAWLTVPAGTIITYEILRDSAGANSGGVFSGQPTLVDWNDNPSAAIRVEKWS